MNRERIPVKISRQTIKPDEFGVGVLEVNSTDGYVLAVLAGNIGTDSIVKVGGIDGVYKNVPTTGSIDISFGVGFPYYWEDVFKFVFMDDGASPVHEVLIELIIEKTC